MTKSTMSTVTPARPVWGAQARGAEVALGGLPPWASHLGLPGRLPGRPDVNPQGPTSLPGAETLRKTWPHSQARCFLTRPEQHVL